MRFSSFLAAVPRVLAEVYHSLGTQLPEALLALLPADFFSDESVSKDSVSPAAPSAGPSVGSLASHAGNGLQNLRDRSANRRRRWVGRKEVRARWRAVAEGTSAVFQQRRADASRQHERVFSESPSNPGAQTDNQSGEAML